MGTPVNPQTVVLASGNAGKLRELDRVLAPLGVTLRSQSEFDVPEVEENGLSFVENAIIKARAAAEHTGLPAIADDSGLEVDYLDGAPGIFSHASHNFVSLWMYATGVKWVFRISNS